MCDPFQASVQAAQLALAKKQYDASVAAAKAAKETGELQARQYASDMFLMQSQAISKSNDRIEEMNRAESQNIAYFYSKLERDDRSVDAFLKNNRELASKDIANIETAKNLETAKYRTQASMSYVYGQNAAAGIRANGSINLLSNLTEFAKAIVPSTSSTSGPVITQQVTNKMNSDNNI